MDPEPRRQEPVERADQDAERERARRHRQRQGIAAAGQVAHEDDDQARQLPDGEIDEAAQHDERLPDGDEAERGRLGQDVGEVLARAELRHDRQRRRHRGGEQPVDPAIAETGREAGALHPRRLTMSSLESTHPNFMAKFLRVAAWRSGA